MYKLKARARFAAVVLAATAALTAPTPATACGSEPYIGAICVFPYNRCPEGYLEADGRTLQVRENQALYSLIGFVFGGNGSTEFKLPDLRGRTPVGLGTGPGLTPVPLGQQRGTETISVAQMPAHTHPVTGGTATVSGLTASVAIPAVGNGNATTDTPGTDNNLAKPNFPAGLGATMVKAYSTAATNTTLKPFNAPVTGSVTIAGLATGATGSGAALGNVDPQLGLRFCIATNGLYPPLP